MRTVIVGASLGGLRVAEALRRLGYRGAIDLVGEEVHLPYDRPPLSKDVLLGQRDASDTVLRDRADLESQGIELHLGARAAAVDADAGKVITGCGDFDFNHLVIATGARPRQLPDTKGLGGVYTIRTCDDAAAIRSAFAAGTKVVVVGAGFIGAEVASSARAVGLDVTVVEALPNPLARAVGMEVGNACAGLHIDNGVTLLCGVGVDRIEGDGRVEAVCLDDGTRLPADLVVAGIGVIPNVEWLRDTGLDLTDGVLCDEYLRAGGNNIYAVGDLARWYNPRYGEVMRVEHWTTTVEQALIVAHNVVSPDPARACDLIPYFWSDQYGRRIQFAGRSAADEVAIFGPGTGGAHFAALYRRGGDLGGALAIDGTRLLMRLRSRMMRTLSWTEAQAMMRNEV